MVYIMSDIHGNARRFHSILSQIQLQPEDKLYILGDVIDRHPDGIRILRRIMAMPNAYMLLGNHEYMMMQALGEPFEPFDRPKPEECLFIWYRNGGDVTHRYWKHIRKTLRAEVMAYLKSLPINLDIEHNGKKYRLVHAAPIEFYEPGVGPYLTPNHYAVWYRWKESIAKIPDTTVIFGHTPTSHYQNDNPLSVWYGNDYIDIDCGCGFPDVPKDPLDKQGRLACLRLDDGKVFYSEENGEISPQKGD